MVHINRSTILCFSLLLLAYAGSIDDKNNSLFAKWPEDHIRLKTVSIKSQANIDGKRPSCAETACNDDAYCGLAHNKRRYCFQKFVPAYILYDVTGFPKLCNSTYHCENGEYICKHFEHNFYDILKNQEFTGICYRETFACPGDALFSYGMPTKNHKTCEYDEDCHLFTDYSDKYVPSCIFDQPTGYNMCCAKKAVCDEKNITRYGHPTHENLHCEEDEDCAVFATNIGTISHKYKCDKRAGKDYGLCCYEDISSKCDRGLPIDPFETCEKNEDCYEVVLKNQKNGLVPVNNPMEWRKYCDEQSKVCCVDSSQFPNTWMCPNGFNPISLEPKCVESDPKDPTSGKCTSDVNAICWHGRCCPNMSVSLSGNVIKSEFGYTSNMPCKNGDKVPEGFLMSYCNNSRVVIIGDIDKLDVSTNVCNSNLYCESLSKNQSICVHTRPKVFVCVEFKPRKVVEDISFHVVDALRWDRYKTIIMLQVTVFLSFLIGRKILKKW